MSKKSTRVALLVGLATVLALGSCGGGGGTVEVDLAEFTIALDSGSVSAWEVIFNVANTGEIPHEFVVVRSDLGATGLPATADGAVDASQVEFIGAIATFDGGASESVSLDLATGNYVLLCNLVDPISHYANGMTTGFVVD